jgi:hypothetical protein
VVKVYEDDKDISDDMRYAGSVHRVKSTDTTQYNYIHFYIPSIEERKFPDAAQYWRDKMPQYKEIESANFDSLLRMNKVVW